MYSTSDGYPIFACQNHAASPLLRRTRRSPKSLNFDGETPPATRKSFTATMKQMTCRFTCRITMLLLFIDLLPLPLLRFFFCVFFSGVLGWEKVVWMEFCFQRDSDCKERLI